MEYKDLKDISFHEQETLKSIFSGILNNLKHLSISKITSIVRYLPDLCRVHHISCENRVLKANHPMKYHPIRPIRGEIFNALITEGVGSELSGNHLVIIVQSTLGNIYGEKVNILPIEGDGKKVNPNYQEELKNDDLEWGKLDKNPSRIIITDITTIDKARLDRKIGKIKPEKMNLISIKLLNQLGLDKITSDKS